MKFKGVMPALVTPLNADETLNVKVLEKLMSDLMAKGAEGFYIGGATGEGLSLAKAERMKLTEETVRIADKKATTIIQVASTCFKDAVDLAKHAEKAGADAISATPPIFYRYDEEDVYNYYKELANSVNLPIMIYYCPLAGFEMSAKFLAKVFEIDNVTAVKSTTSNFFQMMLLKDLTHGEMDILNGCDEMLLQGLSAGADGGIGTTYNFMFDNIKKVYDSFLAGNMEEALKAQTKIANIVSVLVQYEGIPTTKVVLEKMGYEVGNASFPLKRYSDEEKEVMIAKYREAGLDI